MDWRVKGITQKVLGFVPGGTLLGHCLRCWLGELSNVSRDVAAKVADWQGLMDNLRAAGVGSVRGATICEIGAGWHPTIPLCFYLAGAESMLATDINRHMDDKIAMQALDALEPHLDEIVHCAKSGAGATRERLNRLRNADSLEHMLSLARITYRHGHTAGHVGYCTPRSIDIVYSNNVLEHVPAAEITKLSHDTARVLRKGGVAVHAVACNDHYAHFDRSISFVNFLQYSDEEWRKWDNGILWQNRLRAPDFVRLCNIPAALVIYRRQYTRSGSIEAIKSMSIHERFAGYALEDLAATTVHLVTRT